MNNRPMDPLGTLPMPEPPLDPKDQPFRLLLLRSKRSAMLGIWLIAVPVIFFTCILMKYFFHVGIGLVTVLEDKMAALDHAPATGWLSPVLFGILPAIVVVFNLLSVTHVERLSGTLRLTVHLRWLNLCVAALAAGMLGITFLYLVTENCR